MKINIKYIATTLIATMALSATAQTTRSGYFTEGFLYRYEMNPALDNDKNYIAFPALGNVNVGINGNLGLQDLIYNVDGKTTTFLNPAVDTKTFLDAVGNNSKFGTDMKIGILSAGFKAWGGYNTIAINARINGKTNVPTTFMKMLKEGVENKVYDISDLGIHADAYAELALGHSHKINNQWKVGGALKFLVGGANIDADFEQAHLNLGKDAWEIAVEGQLQSSVKGLVYQRETNSNTGHEYVSGMDIDNIGINGFGVAVDLGVEFKPNKDWSFSASVLDLGFINWNNNMLASTNGLQRFTTDKYSFNVDKDMTNSFNDELDKVMDDMSALYELNDMGDQGSRSKMIGATINVGAEFKLPVYRRLSFGLLNTTRIQGDYTWTEFRLSANVNPVKAFSASANLAVGTYGCAFGWLMNVNVTGFNLFVGMDHMVTDLAKQGIPLTSNASVNMGINFPF